MSNTPPEPSDASTEEKQLEQLRSILLGDKNQYVTDAVRAQARELVADVVTEAIRDRQNNDASIDKVLQPIVESSVDASVNNRSDKMVSSLYPLVGSLVRKAVSAFLTDFMEKTNQLLENSLTIKGLKWRFQAWQSGVSFAQYVASQTFVFRVEHVLLIHRETGLLLNNVDIDTQSRGDADLISSMLSAINDFVGDSFAADDGGFKEDLSTISTDNFRLLIKAGPQAMIVAAVSGNPPQRLADHLQITLESVHKLYKQELLTFDGDNSAFDNTEQELRQCLLSEQKPEAQSRSPWLAWAFVALAVLLSGYGGYQWWHKQSLIKVLHSIEKNPGILVTQINSNRGIELHLLRDRDAIPVQQWMQQQEIENESIHIHERTYFSLDHDIVVIRARRVLEAYPEISHRWQEHDLFLNGVVTPYRQQELYNKLTAAGVEVKAINGQGLQSDNFSEKILATGNLQQLFENTRSKINALQLDFEKGSYQLTPEMLAVLERLALYFNQLKSSANRLNLHHGLLIIGVSDNTGSKAANDSLSQRRAIAAQRALTALGITEQEMFTSGLGQIDLSGVGKASRKVLFNVLYINPVDTEVRDTSP